ASSATGPTASATTRWPASARPGRRTTSRAGRRPRWRGRRGGMPAPRAGAAMCAHCGTAAGGDAGPGVLEWLAGGGRFVALDAQGPLRRPEVGPLVLTGTLDAGLLRHVQALNLSEQEAIAAYGTIDASAIRAVSRVPEVLVTFGEWGASLSCEGDSGQVSAQAVTDVYPTGAGDAFLAGYAHARAQGMEPLTAGQVACE